MGKPGPKPKAGERYPSGDLKPASKQSLPPAPHPRAVVNIREMALRKATDPRLGSAIGLLWIAGEVTRQEYRAGLAYARLRGRHDRVLGIPGRFTLSPDYGSARGISVKREPPTDEEIETVREEHRAMQIWIEQGLLPPRCGRDTEGNERPLDAATAAYSVEVRARRTLAMLDRVLVDDLAPEWSEKATLRLALQRLAVFFDIPKKED